jgi:hypothetical protein
MAMGRRGARQDFGGAKIESHQICKKNGTLLWTINEMLFL